MSAAAKLAELLPQLVVLLEGGQPLSLLLRVGGQRLRVKVAHGTADDEEEEEEDGPSAPGPITLSWFWLSPLAVRVVRLMCGFGWMPRDEIAQRLGEQPEGKLSSLLTDLVERRVLESSTRKGYHLSIPDNADAEAYRSRVLLWLERAEREQQS